MTHEINGYSQACNLQPAVVWQHFAELCARPHPSHHEAAVVEYVLEQARLHGFTARLDAVGNVILQKPATAGCESWRCIALQSHLDMVPQKNRSTNHNFTVDPISWYVDGDWVTAQDTTLGADNGIGVAAILSVFCADDITHGPLEALLTINEEAGMTGAKGLQPGELQARVLFNLDSEDDNELFVGCAGGVDVDVRVPLVLHACDMDEHVLVDVALTGLRGGHSGVDIHLGRGNANLLLLPVIAEFIRYFNIDLVSFRGGSLRNAIPREAFATLRCTQRQFSEVKAFLAQYQTEFRARLTGIESDIQLAAQCRSVSGEVVKVCDAEQILALIDAVMACPNGAERYLDDLPDVVAASNNVAMVNFADDYFSLSALTRASDSDERDVLAARVCDAFNGLGAEVVLSGAYPGWQPQLHSPVLAQMSALYSDMFDKQPAIKVIHAGLECGILGATYPQWDMISFGPTIRYPHSPDERVEVASVGRFWAYLTAALSAVGRLL